jgi:hypothetical protein
MYEDKKRTIFPLGDNLKIFKILDEIIPSDKFLDIDPKILSEEQIKSLDLYISYTFENISYYDFEKVTSKFDSIVNDMNQYDIILAPGDSPAKYINAIKLIGLKTPPIILFPASSIDTDPNIKTINGKLVSGGTTNKYQLDKYLIHLLDGYDNIKSIGIFDLMGYGRSYNSISDSLYRIIPNIIIKKVQYPNLSSLYDILTFSENSGSRCVLKYEISDEYPENKTVSNTFRCNVISLALALVYLKMLNNLLIEEITDKVQLFIEQWSKDIGLNVYNLYKNIYNCTWYNIKTTEIMTGFVELNWRGKREFYKFRSLGKFGYSKIIYDSGYVNEVGSPTIIDNFNVNTIISIDDPTVFITSEKWDDKLLLLTLFNGENVFAVKDNFDNYIGLGNKITKLDGIIYDKYNTVNKSFGIFPKKSTIFQKYVLSGMIID